ncbi:PREDICTED: uncharacterized protein LOC103318957 [Prunus mume]|uniref:Uncharacterized protein LOC103318957 n=1 Tax=Prunus mume TaxID=102107 RepID=A0ABM0N2Q9_PRUMU|nr:PREDICTED: uncharacterized protein LOC103318957 [Prunus mume]
MTHSYHFLLCSHVSPPVLPTPNLYSFLHHCSPKRRGRKMIKAVKKLKFWSRKKRKKKTHHHQPYYPPPPPTRPAPLPPGPRHHCCSCSSSTYSTQPSAPPLPPWLDAEYTHEALFAPLVQPAPEFGYQADPRQQEPTMKTNAGSGTTSIYPTSSSYQQYMVPDPVYGVPVAQTTRATTTERSAAAGVFGCVVDFGIRFFRCFCPCFHIREVVLQ